jgi:hypothetical protein
MPNVVIEVKFKYMALGLNKVRLNVGIMVGCPARLYVPLVCELRYRGFQLKLHNMITYSRISNSIELV